MVVAGIPVPEQAPGRRARDDESDSDTESSYTDSSDDEGDDAEGDDAERDDAEKKDGDEVGQLTVPLPTPEFPVLLPAVPRVAKREPVQERASASGSSSSGENPRTSPGTLDS